MSKIVCRLINDQVKSNACDHIKRAPFGWIVTIAEPTRTLEQNSLLWPLLSELAKQTDWHGLKMDADAWKSLFVAEIKLRHKEQAKLIPTFRNNDFIDVSGNSSRVLPKSQFSDLIELIYSFGAERGVVFKEKEYV